MALVAVFSWLILSAWFLPELNPFRAGRIGADAETGAMLGMVRHSMVQVQNESLAYFEEHGRWPKQPLDVFEPDDNGLIQLSMPAERVISFRMANGFARETGLIGAELLSEYDLQSRRWRCRPGVPAPPEQWLFQDCRTEVAEAWAPWQIALLLILALVPISWIWLARFDPLLTSIRANPKLLRQIALDRLPAVDWRLRWLLRRSSNLAVADVALTDWHEALSWASLPLPERLNLLARRISASPAAWTHGQWPGCFQIWQLPPQFPIALERLLVYFPNPELGHRELLQWLRHQRPSDDVLLVVSPNGESDVALNAWAGDPTHIAAYASQAVLSEWLLSAEAESVLVRLLSRQLPVTRISPYQTRGGITRAAGFFGRQQELARILNREPSNYLLVGGRQLGKTSLMKAVERHYQGHPEVACLYVSLRDHRLRARLAQLVGAGAETELAEILQMLQAQSGKRRLLLLLDECDLFLRDDARSGYRQLSELRAQSEEGRCRFILAGFWDLYEAVALDFASPIRNFGDVIRLGPLDQEACLALATMPMRRLGIAYEHAELPELIATQSGGRANLVAIICQYLLENLSRQERAISKATVLRAMKSDAIQDALTGWNKLSPSSDENRLDRAFVYRVALAGHGTEAQISLSDWIAELQGAGVRVEVEQIRRSALRLQVAYVLHRPGEAQVGQLNPEAHHFCLAVPLQLALFEPAETRALLDGELVSLRS